MEYLLNMNVRIQLLIKQKIIINYTAELILVAVYTHSKAIRKPFSSNDFSSLAHLRAGPSQTETIEFCEWKHKSHTQQQLHRPIELDRCDHELDNRLSSFLLCSPCRLFIFCHRVGILFLIIYIYELMCIRILCHYLLIYQAISTVLTIKKRIWLHFSPIFLLLSSIYYW